jgi:hypothetical protein
MDSTLLAAIIGAIATVAAVLIGWYLQRPKQVSPPTPPVLADPQGNEENEPQSFARRYLEYPSHYRFVKALPRLKAIVLENAREGWDTGVTSEMRDASYDVTAFLEYAWLRIAEFYPDRHWSGQSAQDYIQSYIQGRYAFHWSKHEPGGPGTGGTIVGILTGSDVITDLETLISDTVSALLGYNDDFDFLTWKREWDSEVNLSQSEN